MQLNHNQYAIGAIVATLCLAGLYTVVDAMLSTSQTVGYYEPAADDIFLDEDEEQITGEDSDGDGIPNRMEETLYGTSKLSPDTDGDGLGDGWEIENGLDPLDSGEARITELTFENPDADSEAGDQNETFPDPDNGPNGDPDRDGLTNIEEAEIGTNPSVRDSDGDGLNDLWESLYSIEITVSGSESFTLMDPLNPNWDCPLLTATKKAELEQAIGSSMWKELATGPFGEHSCDAVLDLEPSGGDTLHNYLEEQYSTNPLSDDSDEDLIPDRVEVAFGIQYLDVSCGRFTFSVVTKDAPYTSMMADANDQSWFSEDMDGDGKFNGPGDWDTDGDGMPDGFEYCYDDTLDPLSPTDAYGDPDQDGLNNLQEYEVAYTWGPINFTSPSSSDTDGDNMPDGWEHLNGINPRDGMNGIEDPDMDGFDSDGDGSVFYRDLVGVSTVQSISVEIGDFVQKNQTLIWIRTVQDLAYINIPLKAHQDGFIYDISIEVGEEVERRSQSLMTIVEGHERLTNLDEYEARDLNKDGIVDGRSTNPMNPDTDGDGLIDGIEVIGWTIRIVDGTARDIKVRSDPGVFDSDADGLSDSVEYYTTYTNATDRDTDSDGIEDFTEAMDGFQWNGSVYFTNASRLDSDNDGLDDREEVIAGQDQYVTNASDIDSDDDDLKDGFEVLNIPRPWQTATNPLDPDTDGDLQPDGWEMQITSVEDDTVSHSLWIAPDNWLPPGCLSLIECGRGPGGWIWDNYLQGFSSSGDPDGDGKLNPTYSFSELNLTGFTIPDNGRWALDPSFGSLPDSSFDADNDSLPNLMEIPSRWDTNPVKVDTDGDLLPDGWEVTYNEFAVTYGNITLSVTERGPLDPKMIDSDGDGINDGSEDLDSDGLNVMHLMNKYCPGWNDPQNSACHIDPSTPSGSIFYNDLGNYTNYEEYQNGTHPILNDTDGDLWLDGSEVYHQDQDDDSMWSGWEHYFGLDPFDPSDATIDSDADGYSNKCENKYNTNPLNPLSFPGQGELCNQFD